MKLLYILAKGSAIWKHPQSKPGLMYIPPATGGLSVGRGWLGSPQRLRSYSAAIFQGKLTLLLFKLHNILYVKPSQITYWSVDYRFQASVLTLQLLPSWFVGDRSHHIWKRWWTWARNPNWIWLAPFWPKQTKCLFWAGASAGLGLIQLANLLRAESLCKLCKLNKTNVSLIPLVGLGLTPLPSLLEEEGDYQWKYPMYQFPYVNGCGDHLLLEWMCRIIAKTHYSLCFS